MPNSRGRRKKELSPPTRAAALRPTLSPRLPLRRRRRARAAAAPALLRAPRLRTPPPAARRGRGPRRLLPRPLLLLLPRPLPRPRPGLGGAPLLFSRLFPPGAAARSPPSRAASASVRSPFARLGGGWPFDDAGDGSVPFDEGAGRRAPSKTIVPPAPAPAPASPLPLPLPLLPLLPLRSFPAAFPSGSLALGSGAGGFGFGVRFAAAPAFAPPPPPPPGAAPLAADFFFPSGRDATACFASSPGLCGFRSLFFPSACFPFAGFFPFACFAPPVAFARFPEASPCLARRNRRRAETLRSRDAWGAASVSVSEGGGRG